MFPRSGVYKLATVPIAVELASSYLLSPLTLFDGDVWSFMSNSVTEMSSFKFSLLSFYSIRVTLR